ncbi:hypothetical protein Y032_0586g335 [Ancylostoma ceylanicum]|uniref:Uncharacterized protein n=1 Tax=Ancylostoma ceylanicum TaxID=53326 RepID=A0A016WP18_9BILA|nr:hypothetical protein Y032_0586g335 [Ancylostoma ceylanicum]
MDHYGEVDRMTKCMNEAIRMPRHYLYCCRMGNVPEGTSGLEKFSFRFVHEPYTKTKPISKSPPALVSKVKETY